MPKRDREILKADTDDGYTRIANLLLEALTMATMSGVQKGICLYIIRRTYAWGQKSCVITLNDFAMACESNKTYISKQLKELISKKVIIRLTSVYGQVPEYCINTIIAQWDKGCLNGQQLSICATQGLYKWTTQQLSKRTTLVYPEALTDADSQLPKERFKEINKDDDEEVISESQINGPINSEPGMPTPGEVPNSSSDRMPTPAVVPSTNDLKTISEYMAQKMGRLDLSIKDVQIIKKMLATPEMTIDIIIAGIDKSFAKYRPDYDGDKIRSIKFCEPAIMEEHKRIQIQKGGVDIAPAGGRYSKPTDGSGNARAGPENTASGTATKSRYSGLTTKVSCLQ